MLDPTLGGTCSSSSVNPDESVSDDDEVMHELNLGRPCQAPSASELMPKRDVCGTRSNELLDSRLVGGEGHAQELTSHDGLCSVAPRQCEARSSRT